MRRLRRAQPLDTSPELIRIQLIRIQLIRIRLIRIQLIRIRLIRIRLIGRNRAQRSIDRCARSLHGLARAAACYRAYTLPSGGPRGPLSPRGPVLIGALLGSGGRPVRPSGLA